MKPLIQVDVCCLLWLNQDNETINTGGRVLFVVGKGETLQQAKDNAYANVNKISCDGLFYRNDIGDKGL